MGNVGYTVGWRSTASERKRQIDNCGLDVTNVSLQIKIQHWWPGVGGSRGPGLTFEQKEDLALLGSPFRLWVVKDVCIGLWVVACGFQHADYEVTGELKEDVDRE